MIRDTPKLAGWAGCALLLLAPLPWTTATLSYAHPKESLILLLGAVCWAAWAWRGMGDGQARMAWGLGVALAPVCAWLAFAGAAGSTALGVALAALAIAPLAIDTVWRARLEVAFIAGTILVALLALGQFLGLLNSLFPVYAHYDQRAYSVFGNQDMLGGYIAVALVALWGRVATWPNLATMLLQLPLLAALGVSGCRSAWVAAVMGLLFVAWGGRAYWRRYVGMAGTLSVSSFLLLLFAWESTGARIARLFSGADTGASVRLWIWDAALRMFGDHPLWGVGAGAFARHSPEYMGQALAEAGEGAYAYNEAWAMHAHSEPLNVLAEGGLLGVGVVMLSGALLVWMRTSTSRPLTPPVADKPTPLHLSGGEGTRGIALAPLCTMGAFALVNDAWHSAPHALVTLWLVACTLPCEANTARRVLLPRVLTCAAAALLCLHTYAVLWPSVLLTRAEDKAMAGGDAVAEYTRAASHDYTRGEAMLGLATYHVEHEAWPEALASATNAAEVIDTSQVHWLMGLSAARLHQDDLARESLGRCLYRAPKNAAALQLLKELSDKEK